jgi:hypothetical protein
MNSTNSECIYLKRYCVIICKSSTLGWSGGGGLTEGREEILRVDAGITKLRCCSELTVGTWVVTFCVCAEQQ